MVNKAGQVLGVIGAAFDLRDVFALARWAASLAVALGVFGWLDWQTEIPRRTIIIFSAAGFFAVLALSPLLLRLVAAKLPAVQSPEVESPTSASVAFDQYRYMFSRLMRVDVNGLWIEQAPHIDFIVRVRNASDWTVTLDDIRGRANIGGVGASLPPMLLDAPTILTDPRREWECTIRQPLLPEMAREFHFHPGDLNLFDENAKVAFSLGGIKWVGSVSMPQGSTELPACVVLGDSFTILGPVRENDGDKLLWATDTVVISQVHRQQHTGELKEEG